MTLFLIKKEYQLYHRQVFQYCAAMNFWYLVFGIGVKFFNDWFDLVFYFGIWHFHFANGFIHLAFGIGVGQEILYKPPNGAEGAKFFKVFWYGDQFWYPIFLRLIIRLVFGLVFLQKFWWLIRFGIWFFESQLFFIYPKIPKVHSSTVYNDYFTSLIMIGLIHEDSHITSLNMQRSSSTDDTLVDDLLYD